MNPYWNGDRQHLDILSGVRKRAEADRGQYAVYPRESTRAGLITSSARSAAVFAQGGNEDLYAVYDTTWMMADGTARRIQALRR